MACSNCFNGCTEIISDQCVRYTGISIPALEINTGDTLSSVESKITTFILNLSTGEGIIPVIDNDDLCALVSGFLPGSGDITLNNVLSALIQSVCSLKTSVDGINSTLNTLNADYTIGCLSGVTASSDTHDILQAAINKLCATDSALTAFIANVTTNYVELADLNTLIQAYLDSITPASFQKNKMVPYVAYEYYPLGGSLSNFDFTGKGIDGTEWDRVFLCNGYNGTPDKRGRVAVGVTTGMGGGTMNTAVNPGGGNPNYTLGGTTGANTVQLTEQQLPSHNHTATATSTADPHTHLIARVGNSSGDLTSTSTLDTQASNSPDRFSYTLQKVDGDPTVGRTSSTTVNVNTVVTIADKGGNQPHTNVQPGIGAYYIMYIP
jgi:microcystin-dependent protein